MAAKAFGVSELNIDDINIKSSNGSITANITGSAVKSTNSTGLIAEDTGYSSLQTITAEELPNRGFGYGNTNLDPSRFGWSVSISSDKSTIAVGDRGYKQTTSDQGKIYIYSKNPNSSTYNNDYTSSVETIVGLATARVGDQVTLNSDGTYLTTKEVQDESFSTIGISDNVLSLYNENNNSWSLVEVSTFTSPNAKTVFNPRDESLIYDGRHTPTTAGTFYGEIRVYDSSNLTGVGTITFTDTGNIVQSSYSDIGDTIIGFGKKFTVANINISGSTYTDRIIAGLPNATNGTTARAGAVAIFDKSVSGNTWTQVATIEPPAISTSGFFGADVASSEDGKTIIVTSGHPSNTTGTANWEFGEKITVYIYKNVLNSNGYVSTNYVLEQTLEVEKYNSNIFSYPLASISCTSDANRFIVMGNQRGTETFNKDTADVFDRAGPDSLYVKTAEWTHSETAQAYRYAASGWSRSVYNYDQQGMQISRDGTIALYANFTRFYFNNDVFSNVGSTNGFIEIFNLDSGSLPTSNQLLKTNASGADIYINGNSVSKVEQISTAGVSAGGTITMDLSNANNYTLSLDNNFILGNPINIIPGQSGFISIAQTAGGGKTLGWGDYWEFADGIAPTLTLDANDINLLGYYVRSTTSIVADIVSDIG